ncbi:MAG: hypothetical protein GY866_37770 [Proteobacteria bacterium]|nr:hypothetical protein [Pseudomonadota bacterium]
MEKVKTLLKTLGPGIIFASLCIGETHLALLAYAGALYGHVLLWLVVLVHLVYYPNYEYGPRYAVATGENLIDGYAKLKVGRGLMWIFMIMLFVTPIMVMGSLVGLSGSVLYAAMPFLDFRIWCLLVYIVTVGIVIGGKYKLIERISKLLVLIIVMTSIMVFAVSPPSPGEFVQGLLPAIPAVAGAMVVIVAVLRVPTDPASSIFLSEWAQEKRQEWLDDPEAGNSGEILVTTLKKSVFDVRLGFFLSALVAVIFLSVGATVLRPLGIVPEGIDVSLKLSEIYTQTIGRWIFPVFIVTMFAAFWGGYVSAMDGIFRLFKSIMKYTFKPSEQAINKLSIPYILLVTTVGLLMATLIQRPMVMVLIAVSLGLIMYPFIYAMNIYLVTRKVDPIFRPGKLNLTLAALGFIVGVGGLILLILVRVLKVIV